MGSKTNSRNGFTIVELLIVIVIIAILAAITIVSYNGIKQRAQAASITTGLNQVHKAMSAWAATEGLSQWPHDDDTITSTPGAGDYLSDMAEYYPTLGEYLSSIPQVADTHSEEWFYDSDDDSRDPAACFTGSTTGWDRGTNIVIRYVHSEAVALAVDSQLDDGNPNCGKVIYKDGRIFYALSFSNKIQ